MASYLEHGEFLHTVAAGALAERDGFQDAQTLDAPRTYPICRYQWRYEQGFSYGKHLLKKGPAKP